MRLSGLLASLVNSVICAVVGKSRSGGTDFTSQHMSCSQNSPLTSALAALSSGPHSTKQETFARTLYRSKVLKTCRLPVYLVHTTYSVNEGSFNGFLEEVKSLQKMHLKTLSVRDLRKTDHTIRS